MYYDPLFTGLLILGVVISVGRYVYRRKGLRPSFPNSPVLLVQSTQGDIITGQQGHTPAGLPYTYMVGSTSLFSNSNTVGVFAIYLPFKTSAHLVGIPRDSRTVTVRALSSAMEPVVLEGDYPNYFQLFADRGQQAESRYVLDPKAMVFTIDFCKNTHWEIANNTLYFLSAAHLPSFDEVDQFIAEIRPAIEVPATRDHSQISYGATPAITLSCPICKTQLSEGVSWMECPRRHGFLITGRQMKERRKKMISVDHPAMYNDGRSEKLTCPYCSQPMIASRFQATDITIDRCSKCVYRWIDAPEAEGVLGVISSEH